MPRIPDVKTWIVTTDDGKKYEVTAPTKLLARLNFRHQHVIGYSSGIRSIGVKRKGGN
mgnify:CR=1 FL=1